METGESIVDFRDSFLNWKIYGDFYGRASSECIITKGNGILDKHEEFILSSGVLACKVLAGESMITEPAYLYHACLSEKQFKIFRHGKSLAAQDDHGAVADRYDSVSVDIKRTTGRKLLTEEDVIDAALLNKRISVVIKLTSDNDHYILEFPAKHVYHHSGMRRFQIETGPVLLPADPADIGLLHSWNMCYIAFNTFQKLEYSMIRNNVAGQWQYQDYTPSERLSIDINVYSSL